MDARKLHQKKENRHSGMKKAVIVRCMVAFHFIVTVVLFLCCWTLFYRFSAQIGEAAVMNRSVCASYIFMLAVFGRVYSAYKIGVYRVEMLVRGQVLSSLMSWGFAYFLTCILSQRLHNPLMGLVFLLIQSGFGALWTLYMHKIYCRFYQPKRTVVLYRSEEDLRKIKESNRIGDKWRIDGYIRCIARDDEPIAISDAENCTDFIDGNARQLMTIIDEYEAVFVAGVNGALRDVIVERCVEAQKDCYFIPSVADIMLAGAAHLKAFSLPIFQICPNGPTSEFLMMKRAFDVCAAGIALIVLWPLMLIIAILIRSCDHGPAIYKQIRLTKDGKEFEMLKFRSMKISSESDGIARLASENDDRITPIGKVIRANHLDELPQLINILKGDMSIVGPRPERPEIAEEYMKELPDFKLRLSIKAGLTGYAQVYGRYNTEPVDKLKMDLMYIHNMSILEDLKLIMVTLQVLLMKENSQGIKIGQRTAIYSDTEAEMEKTA